MNRINWKPFRRLDKWALEKIKSKEDRLKLSAVSFPPMWKNKTIAEEEDQQNREKWRQSECSSEEARKQVRRMSFSSKKESER